MSLLKCAAFAVLVFLVLFGARLAYRSHVETTASTFSGVIEPQFDLKTRNYASEKMKPQPQPDLSAPPLGPTQKYEKIASVGLVSDGKSDANFTNDRATLFTLIGEQKAVIQYELSRGMAGHRTLDLAIGVPPEKFDDFIASLSKIGTTASIEVAKNDKTNEYLELRAKKAALEKARSEVEAIALTGASVDERLKLSARLSEIDANLQELGVSLGEFDTQNELCTVKISLAAKRLAARPSFLHVAEDALEWTALVYAGLGAGFMFTTLSAWVATIVLRLLVRTGRELRTSAS